MIDQRAEYLEAVEEYQIAVEDFIDNFRFYLEDWEIQIWKQKQDGLIKFLLQSTFSFAYLNEK